MPRPIGARFSHGDKRTEALKAEPLTLHILAGSKHRRELTPQEIFLMLPAREELEIRLGHGAQVASLIFPKGKHVTRHYRTNTK